MLAPTALVLGVALTPLPPQSPDVPWPTSVWPTGAPVLTDAWALETALAATAGVRPELGETRAVVVIQGGRLVAERYAPGFTAETRLLSWSVAKSITHALVGLIVRDGRISIDDALPHPIWPNDDPRAGITWRQWLSMTDGLDYAELGEGVVTSDAAKMTFGSGHHDVIAYMRERSPKYPPGTHWNYSSGGINVAAYGVASVVAPSAETADARRRAMLAFMKTRLFDVIGMHSAQPEFDPQGNFVGGSLLYATARDFAKLGLLYLRDGVWNGERVLPEGWVDFARTPCAASNIDTYGAGWWITAAQGRGTPYASLTQGPWKDAFEAEGRGGQLIVVVPSKDLVIVRLGQLPSDGHWDGLGRWVDGLVGAFPDHP